VAGFLVRRVLLGALVLWLITVLVFIIFYIGPSDVARTLAGRQATPDVVELIRHRLGLDKPIWQQYLTFLGNALRGNLGYDYYHQVPVTSIIAGAIPKTLSLAVGAAVLWLALGVFNGVLSAVRPRTFGDRALTVFSLGAPIGAVPSFVDAGAGEIPYAEFLELWNSKGEGKALLVDVRPTASVPFARHLPLDRLPFEVASLPRDRELVLFCAIGKRSRIGYELLKREGFRVRYLRGAPPR